MTINKKNFRSTLVALAFGTLVTVLPSSATTISVSTAANPTTVGVGGYDWTYNGSTTSTLTLPSSGGLTYSGGSASSEFGSFSAIGDTGATAGQSEVIDVNVTPTINGTKATTAVTFQGTIEAIGSGSSTTYELVFNNNGTQECANTAVSCATTSNGNVVNNGQQIVTIGGNTYTEMTVNGMEYAVQTNTFLNPSKGTYVNGFIGVTGVTSAPEPSTYAMSGMAAAFLGLFLRRKAKQNS